jgi:hypothetical protein
MAIPYNKRLCQIIYDAALPFGHNWRLCVGINYLFDFSKSTEIGSALSYV